MNELQLFNHDTYGQIRAIQIDGEPWFVAKDVCDALDLGNSRQAVSRLDDDEKGVISNDTPGGNQDMSIINEPGLYTLVLGSRKPEAKAFKRWITHEVIPSIRKHGVYAVPSALSSTDILELQVKAMREIERKQAENAVALEAMNRRLDDTCDLIALNPNSWRPEAKALIVKIAQRMGGNAYIRDVNADIYKLVNERAGVSLETRLTNKRRRMADEGICKSQRDRLTRVDVIADDKKLIEIYLAVVKEYAIKAGVALEKKTAS